MARPAIAEINLESIRANFRLASSLTPNGKTVAVIKADAYGHGAVQVAEYLSADAEVFAVACIEEALELRASGLRHPILLLEGFFEIDELETISREGFWTAVHRQEQIDQLAWDTTVRAGFCLVEGGHWYASVGLSPRAGLSSVQTT